MEILNFSECQKGQIEQMERNVEKIKGNFKILSKLHSSGSFVSQAGMQRQLPRFNCISELPNFAHK